MIRADFTGMEALTAALQAWSPRIQTEMEVSIGRLTLILQREVYFYPQRLRHHRVPRKFLAPVWRDAVHHLLAQGFNHRRIHAVRRFLLQPDANQVATHPVNQREKHRTAHHACNGIGFPVANAFPRLRLWRTLRQRMHDREVIARRVALAPPLLATVAQPFLAAYRPVGVIETPWRRCRGR